MDSLVLLLIVVLSCSVMFSAIGGVYYYLTSTKTEVPTEQKKKVPKKPNNSEFKVLQNKFDGKCLSYDGTSFSFEKCDDTSEAQLFAYHTDGVIFQKTGNCLGVAGSLYSSSPCTEGTELGDSRTWQYDNFTYKTNDGKCIEHSNTDKKPFLNTCVTGTTGNIGQKWNTFVDTTIQDVPSIPAYLIKYRNSNALCLGQGGNFSCPMRSKAQEWLRTNNWLQNSSSQQCMQDANGAITYGTCDATNNNQKFEQSGVNIKNTGTGKCITLQSTTKDCNADELQQQFTLVEI